MPTRHIKRTTQVTLTIFDGLYSKRAISLSLEQSTFASTCRASNCTFYYALSDGCQTELLSQNAETAVSFSPLQRPQVPSSYEWPVSAPPPAPAPQTGQLRGNCRKLPNFLVPTERRERSPGRRAEEMRRKASRRADPGTIKCPKSRGESKCTSRPLLPRMRRPHRLSSPPARQIDT